MTCDNCGGDVAWCEWVDTSGRHDVPRGMWLHAEGYAEDGRHRFCLDADGALVTVSPGLFAVATPGVAA